MNKTTAILGAATLALGVSSSYLWMQVRAEREQRGALQARVQELESGTGTAPQIVELSSALPAPGTSPEAAAANGTPRTSAGAGNKNPSPQPFSQARLQDVRESQARLLRNPEYRAAMRSQQRASLQQMYPDLASALRLQPEQLDKLLDLLAEHQLQSMNVSVPFEDLSAGTPAEQQQRTTEWRRRFEEEQSRRDAEIASLLGSRYQDWQEYQGSLGARMQVRELRNILDGSSDPLRSEQVQPLVAALAQAQRLAETEMRDEMLGQRPMEKLSPEERLAFFDRLIERTQEYQQRVHDAVSPHLTAKQLEYYDQMMKQQVDMQQAQLSMMREQQAAVARGEIPATDENVILGSSAVAISGQQ